MHHALHVLDDDDGVVDDDADREHETEERDGVEREPEHLHHGERADERDRDRQHRNQGRPEAAEEDEHDRDHENERLDERVVDLVERRLDELRDVVVHVGAHPAWQARLLFFDEPTDVLRDLDRVSLGRLVDDQDHGGPAVASGGEVVVLGADLRARDVAESDDATRVVAHDDLIELLGFRETPERGHAELEGRVGRHRLLSETTRRHLDVLGPDGVRHVGGRGLPVS